MKRILIVRPDAIGDFVIFSAVLDEYAALYKNYKIDLLCDITIKDLTQHIPFINQVIYFDILKKLFRRRHLIYTFLSFLKIILLRYDKVIYPVYSRSKPADLLIKFVRAKEKVAFDGDHLNDSDNRQYKRNKFYTRIIKGEKINKLEIERNCEFINKLGANIDFSIRKPRIWFSERDENEIKEINKKYNLKQNSYLAVFLGAGHPIRHWDNEKWVELIQQIIMRYPEYKIVMLGYGTDIYPIEYVLNRLEGSLKGNIINLYAKTSLRILAKVIQKAKILIGTETGAMHIAAAMNTPNVCIMGGGHFGRFYPYGDLDNNRVVYKTMDCYGCNWECKYKYPKCLSEIGISDVIMQVENLLKS